MSNTVKSVFRQREIEKIYELVYSGTGWIYPRVDDDVALTTTGNTKNIISDKVIGTYDVEIPMLEVGDEFFLHDIQEVVKIKNRMRSSDGSITYYAEDKVLETEHTKKTYADCREKIEHYKIEKEKFEEYKKKYRYQHRFFNIRCSE